MITSTSAERFFLLWGNDLKQMLRDPMQRIFLLAPLVLIAFARYAVPYFCRLYPVLDEHLPAILLFGAMQTSVLFGFISTFLILEEKDEQVLQVIRILPLSVSAFLWYRLSFAALFSALGAWLLLQFAGIAHPGQWRALLIALHCGCCAPFIVLVIATFAKNKIEGLAWFKGLNLLLVLSGASMFTEHPAVYALAWLPTFWTYRLYGAEPVEAVFLGSLAYMVLLAVVLGRLFERRVMLGGRD